MRERLSRWAPKILNFLLWFALGFYVLGGVYIKGKLRLTYPRDVFMAVGAVYILARLTLGVRFSDTQFGKAWGRIFEIKALKEIKNLPRASWVQLVCAAYLVALFFYIPVLQYWNFNNSFDLSIYFNTIYNGAMSGKFFTYMLIREHGPTHVFPNNHLDFGLFLFAGLYRIFKTPEIMLVGQSLALLSGMIPLALLSRKLLPKVPVWVFPLMYWFWDPIHRINIWDFHETPFLIPFCLWAFYFIEVRRLGWAIVMMILMAAWREDAWWTAACMSFYAGIRTRKWWVFGPATLAGLALFPLHAFLVNSTNNLSERYYYLGDNIHSASAALKAKPWILLEQAWINHKFFLGLIGLAGGPFFLLAGWALLPLIPPVAECGLSTWDGMLNFINHYPATYAGPLFFAVLQGWRVWLDKKWPAAILSVSVAFACMHLSMSEPGGFRKSFEDRERRECLNGLIAKIPPNDPVLASDPVEARLAMREWISLPHRWITLPRAEWPKVDHRPARWLVTNDEKNLSESGLKAPDGSALPPWEVVTRECGLVLAKRSENFLKKTDAISP